MSNSTEWKISFPDDRTHTEYEEYFKKYPKQSHVKNSFETDVTANPLSHSTLRRIIPLKGQYKGLFRYGKSETRIVYKPIIATKTVFPLETAKVTDVSYKKRSKKR